MTPELTALTLAALLQVAQFLMVSVTVNLELGVGKTASPRDRSRLGGSLEELLSDKPARLVRALNNHFEGLILFGIACLVVSLSEQSTAFTAACAWAYLCARIAYIPAYYLGWSPWRSYIWMVGFGATALMLIAALL